MHKGQKYIRSSKSLSRFIRLQKRGSTHSVSEQFVLVKNSNLTSRSGQALPRGWSDAGLVAGSPAWTAAGPEDSAQLLRIGPATATSWSAVHGQRRRKAETRKLLNVGEGLDKICIIPVRWKFSSIKMFQIFSMLTGGKRYSNEEMSTAASDVDDKEHPRHSQAIVKWSFNFLLRSFCLI